MYVVIPPQETFSEFRLCPFHERHPGRSFPGCTCSGGIGTRDKPMEKWTEEERAGYFAALRGERPDGTPLF